VFFFFFWAKQVIYQLAKQFSVSLRRVTVLVQIEVPVQATRQVSESIRAHTGA